jgi:hypothetical protein
MYLETLKDAQSFINFIYQLLIYQVTLILIEVLYLGELGHQVAGYNSLSIFAQINVYCTFLAITGVIGHGSLENVVITIP